MAARGRWLAVGLAAAMLLATGGSAGAEDPAPSVFDVVLLSLESDWQAMRYHLHTGESWYAYRGDWKPIPEADSTKPPAGEYKIVLSQTGENDWIAVRLERKSGRTWRLAALKWAEMKIVEGSNTYLSKRLN